MPALTLLLTEHFADWECALLSAAARTHLGCGVTVATPDGLPVTSMGGLRVTPHAPLERIDPKETDALLIAGGTSWESATPPDIAETLRTFDRSGRLIAGICGGTIAMARAGLLNTRRHTSNSRETLRVEFYAGEALYSDQPGACRDRHIITAPGTAPLTFTAEVLGALGLGGPALTGFLDLFTREKVGLAPT